MTKTNNVLNFKNLDKGTQNRLEKLHQRELEADAEINYIQYYWEEKLKLTFLEILEFAWEKGRNGVARSIMKEKFMSELVDGKLKNIPFDELMKALQD